MSENVYKFISKRQVKGELHNELLTGLDRCLELSMILERCTTWREEYQSVGDYIYKAFGIIEDLKPA